MTTPNAGLYELTGDQRCITTVPMGQLVNIHFPQGSIETTYMYDYTHTNAFAWSPIVPAKRKVRFVVQENGLYGPFSVTEVGSAHSAAFYLPTRESAQRIADIYNEVMP